MLPLLVPTLLLLGMPLASARSSAAQRVDVPLGLDLYLPVPEDNPLTPAKIALGQRLFSEPILSADRTIACSTCHHPDRAFTNGAAVAEGVFGREGVRNVPTLVNRAYGRFFFWDGRTTTLEEQVVRPIEDPAEMGLSVSNAVTRLQGHTGYPTLFRAVFGRAVNADDLSRALAAYVRTILSGAAPVDRYLAGDRDALDEQALRGLSLFRGRAGCSRCHHGPNFTDESFHNTGIAWRGGRLDDLGRFALTGSEQDRGAFKTPTLREVSRTAPYMHDGSLQTLAEIIDFYDRGGNQNPHLDAQIHPLNLTPVEKEALVRFLESLSGELREGLPERAPGPLFGPARAGR